MRPNDGRPRPGGRIPPQYRERAAVSGEVWAARDPRLTWRVSVPEGLLGDVIEALTAARPATDVPAAFGRIGTAVANLERAIAARAADDADFRGGVGRDARDLLARLGDLMDEVDRLGLNR